MTVGDLCDRLTVFELQDWATFCEEHPLPADLIDVQGAMLCALLANINRAVDSTAYEVSDFRVIRPRTRPEPEVVKPTPTMTEADRLRAFFGRG